MKTEKTLLILWTIFGFVFVQAIDSVLYFLINLIYFGTVSLEIPYSTLNFLLPIITILTYLITIIVILKRIEISSASNGILFTKFPKIQFIILLIIAIALNALTNKLSGLFAEWTIKSMNPKTTEFLELYGWMHMGIGVARWISVVGLGLIYLNKYKLKKTKHNNA